METEIVLTSAFIISLAVIKTRRKTFEFAQAGRIAMSAMLVLTSIGHFAFAKGMAMIIPDFLPFKLEMVYITGVLEMIAAVGLLIPRYRVMTGWWLIVLFILLLPANIYEAIHHIDIQKANFDGKGLSYLWYRVPLQLFFIAWVYFTAIRNIGSNAEGFRTFQGFKLGKESTTSEA